MKTPIKSRVNFPKQGFFSILLGETYRPKLKNLVEPGDPKHALRGEDAFFELLLANCHNALKALDGSKDADIKRRIADAKRLILKLVDRRVYRPLVIIPGDRAARHFQIARPSWSSINEREYRLRTLATIVNSKRYEPFLLFASECIEEYLLGTIEDDKCLKRCIARITADSSELTRKAMEAKPSRVLIWALPYKQLYKDPALVVTLADWIDPIDVLAGTGLRPGIGESVFERIEKAIADADSKYAALWGLYVFVSDSLYYTGLRNKVLNGPNTKTEVQLQVTRLEQAQIFMIAALDAICRDWSEYCESVMFNKPLELQRQLGDSLSEDEFRALAELWMSKYQIASHGGPRSSTARLSAVDVNRVLKKPCFNKLTLDFIGVFA